MKTSAHRISFTVFVLILATGWLSGQTTSTNGNTITLNGAIQRNLIAPSSATQVIIFQNLIPGEKYSLIVPDDPALGDCRPDIVATDTSARVASFDITARQLVFDALQKNISFRLDYPCSWEPSNPPRHYISLVCETCVKKDLKSYMESLNSVLEVQGGQSAEDLVKDVLIGGNCFDVQNVTFSGNSGQIGTFTNGFTNIGFNTGVIMATGDINIAPGPNDSDIASAGYGISTPDNDLSQLTTGALFDMADIEFDFTPIQSPVTFNFVFASEEYCEYVGSQFNDVLGFFLSGPGIPGGQQNIALIPGTNLPVTVNNVNHLSYSGFYVNNQPVTSNNLCGQQPSASPAVNEIQYDGFTRKFTAVANVQTCQTYHIKLKIADVGDGVEDSAVFLNAGSFSAGANASVTWEVNGRTDINEVYEGSSTVKLIFDRVGGNPNIALPVQFTVTGTATMGTDYSPIPSVVIIPAGQQQLILNINIVNDNILEGAETVILTLTKPCSCLNPQKILTIKDPVPTYLLTTSENNLKVCAGTNGFFTANLTSVCGFNSPVALSVTGAPPGATVNISANPVTPTGVVKVTISGLNLPGNFALTLIGVGGGITQTDTVTLTVSPGIPAAPSAISPADGETGVATTAFLSWAPVAGAENYLVQVATAPTFTTIVTMIIQSYLILSQIQSGTTITINDLKPGTVYYWRVKAINECGMGDYSTFAFQTGDNQCNQNFNSTNVPKAIDQNTVNTITSTLYVPTNKYINEVIVSLVINHSWTGDLSARLISPSNDTILLFDRPGVPASSNGCNGHNAVLTFDDQASKTANDLEITCNTSPPSLSGIFQPIGLLKILNGKNAQGTWKLSVTDSKPIDGGSLVSWGLSFCFPLAIPNGSILTNNPLAVSSGGSGTIDNAHLKMTVTGQGEYTILDLPKHGLLKLNGYMLSVGGTFTQADVNGGWLSYTNNGDFSNSDNFHFDANSNGWVHDVIFNINILPSFLMATSVDSLDVCTGTSGAFTTNLTSISGYASPVTLIVTGAPSGSTVNISANPISPNGIASVTISGLTIPGNYPITVKAMSGSIVRTSTVSLTVSSGIPGVASATSPTNGESGISTTALLTWTAATAAYTYVVEVATNPSFSAGSIVSSQTVSDTRTTVSGLQIESVYYWRIRAINACGTGNNSLTYTFQTGRNQCSQNFSSTDVPTGFCEVFDGPSTCRITSSLNIPVNKIINDVNVSVAFNHDYVGLLSVWLMSPSGDLVQLFDRPGFPASTLGCPGNDGALIFDSQSGPGVQEAAALEAQCNATSPALIGTFKPIESLDVLTGEKTLGEWKLTIEYNSPWGQGYGITAWSLSFCFPDTIPAGILLVNSPLDVSTGQSGTIQQSNLKMGTTGALCLGVFTLLSLPQHGSLTLNGNPLVLGSLFTQEDINNNKLVYNKNCDGALMDNFHFDAVDQNNSAWVHDAVFNINIISTSLTATAAQTIMILCHNGTTGAITVAATPQNGIYIYSLNGGQSQSSNVFSGLSAGTYTVVVTDQCGVTVSTNPVTFANPLAIFVSASVACDDVTVTASGGTGALEYSINGGPFQSSNKFFNLTKGNYTFIVRDANGCTAIVGAVVAVTPITLAPPPSIHPISCRGGNDGEIEVMVSGGQMPYSFSLNGGTSQGDNVFKNLASGTYTIVVVDNAGCSATSAALILNDPPALQISAIVTGNMITAQASGGTGFLEYSIDGANFQVGNQFSNLCSGIYTLTVRDQKGCAKTTVVTVDAGNIVVNISNVQHTCFGESSGSATVSASGGAPYQYMWSNGQTGTVATNLAAGIYTVTVSNIWGCTATVTATINSISTPQASISNIKDACSGQNNGSATAVVSGGIAPFQYAWSNGQSGLTATNLASGTYSVTITGANGCTAKTTAIINVASTPKVELSSVINACSGHANGSVSVQVNWGVAPYQYSWNNGQNGTTAANLPPGTYTITVTGANSCSTTASAEVKSASTPVAGISSIVGACPGQNNGSATVGVSGGVTPYQYTWSNGQKGETATNLPGGGTFTVTVTGANGCTTTAVAVIDTASAPNAGISGIVGTCSGQNSGSARVLANGGVTPYQYIWSNGQTGSTATNLAGGIYTVTVTGANGCTAFAVAVISTISTQVVEISIIKNACSGQNNGSATVAVTGGEAPYKYGWSNGQTGATVDNLPPGTYTITVTGANGCSVIKSVAIGSNPAIITTFQTTELPTGSCQVTLTITGGTAPYKYAWSNGGDTAKVVTLPKGDFSVTVADAIGCTSTQTGICNAVATNEIPELEDISLFPNPSEGVVHLKARFARPIVAAVHVFDVLGTLKRLSTASGEEIALDFDFSSEPDGMYFLEIHVGSASLMRKFVITN